MKRNHRDLRVWQQAMALVEAIYILTSSFPSDERFGLTQQLRRAAVPVPANIAEGFARNGSRELIHFLGIAAGSLSELDTLLDLGHRLGFCTIDDGLRTQVDEVSGMLMALAASIRKRV